MCCHEQLLRGSLAAQSDKHAQCVTVKKGSPVMHFSVGQCPSFPDSHTSGCVAPFTVSCTPWNILQHLIQGKRCKPPICASHAPTL